MQSLLWLKLELLSKHWQVHFTNICMFYQDCIRFHPTGRPASLLVFLSPRYSTQYDNQWRLQQVYLMHRHCHLCEANVTTSIGGNPILLLPQQWHLICSIGSTSQNLHVASYTLRAPSWEIPYHLIRTTAFHLHLEAVHMMPQKLP